MAAAEKAWHKAFTVGSKALQDKLRKVHAKNPEFQAFLGKHGFDGGSSVKQASKAQTVSKEVAAKRTALSDKAYGATKGQKVGGEHGSNDEYKDTVVPLTKDQRSKVQAAERQAKQADAPAAKVTKAPKQPKPEAKKPLSKDERLKAIMVAARKARTGERYEIPTEDPDDAGHDDMMDLHHSLHIGHGSLDEEIHKVNVTVGPDYQQKTITTSAKTPEEATEFVKNHLTGMGYDVHDVEHIGIHKPKQTMVMRDKTKMNIPASLRVANKSGGTTTTYDPVSVKEAKAEQAGIEEAIDPNDMIKFGANFAAYEYGIKPAIDHIVKPAIKAVRNKLKDKLANKAAPAQAVPVKEAKAVVSTKNPVGYTITDAGSGKVEKSGTLTTDDLPKTKTVDNNYLNNKKSQIRESILSKLAAKTGKK